MYRSMKRPQAVGTPVLVYGDLEGELHGIMGTTWSVAVRDKNNEYRVDAAEGYCVWVRNPQAWKPLPPPPGRGNHSAA